MQVLAGDPSLRGVIQALQFGLLGVQGGRITLDAMTWPMTLGADAIEKVNAGQPATFSWRDMVQGRASTPGERRKFLNIQGMLDYSELEPGLKATNAIRKAAADLNFAGDYQASLRLTGPVPMADEEFATIKENAGLNATVTIAIVLFILWLALRWFRIIFAVFVSLVVGLAVTAAAGMLMVGTLNLISVYFAVLFVGLGVDFGLQFSVRYRAERHEVDNLHEALLQSGRRAGAPLTLAALATAAGFLSFLPTDYKGVSELGLIAGVGMLIAFFTSITLLPALLSRLKPPSEPQPPRLHGCWRRSTAFLERHRMPILIGTLLVVAAGLPLLYHLQFDFNPMNLRSKTAESVATYLELKNDPESGANDIEILQPTLAQADAMAAKLRALPQVGRVTTLSTFIPDQQSEKLALIADAAKTLNPALNPTARGGADVRRADRQHDQFDGRCAHPAGRRRHRYRRGCGQAPGRGHDRARQGRSVGAAARRGGVRAAAEDDTRRFAQSVEGANDHPRKSAARRWPVTGSRPTVRRASTSRRRATRTTTTCCATLPTPCRPSRRTRPRDRSLFLEARRTVVTAFIVAGACALLSIAIILWITLRRISDVLLTLIPLLMAGVVTLEICVLIGMPLNFANIIALPLLLGVGVAFKIYYIMAWREGQTNLLQSVLTRAVTFSACTTATAFGSLWFSSHPGTSSMGKLLAISLMTTMAAAALFQPILMGKPRQLQNDAPKTVNPIQTNWISLIFWSRAGAAVGQQLAACAPAPACWRERARRPRDSDSPTDRACSWPSPAGASNIDSCPTAKCRYSRAPPRSGRRASPSCWPCRPCRRADRGWCRRRIFPVCRRPASCRG